MDDPGGAFSVGSLALDLFVVFFFIALGAIFVAAEIALISLREGQAKAMVERGRRGRKVAELAGHPNRFLAAVQVGVTLSGFLSAAFGADQLGDYLIPVLEGAGLSEGVSSGLSLVILTLIIAYFSLVLGELVPKRLALHKTESIALAVATPVAIISKVFKPLIWLLAHSSDLILRGLGIDPKASREEISEEELVDLVTGHKALSEEERDIVEEVFNASERLVHEIMVPRTEVDFLDASLTFAQATEIATQKAHSRFPVVRGNSDEVIGFIHVRDLLDTKRKNTTLLDLIRPIMYLPGTKGVLPALSEMRAQRQQIAIVLDEYGGTDGIVTLEDLVETLIGDIHDEYDAHETEVTSPNTNEFQIEGLISLEDLHEKTGVEIPEGPYETLSGYVMHELGRIPVVNDEILIPGARIKVLSMEGKRVGTLQLKRI
ncbi:MAG: hemolysin family protein [Actinomycetales bacterium]